MPINRRVFAALALLLVGPFTFRPATLQKPATASPAVIADLDAVLSRIVSMGATPGLAVAIVHDSEVIYSKGFGVADRERNLLVTPDTQFYIASTTKSMTALAGATLAARGEVDLAAPLSRELPDAEFQPGIDREHITLRDLLTHTHGISPGPVDFRMAYTGDFTTPQLMKLLALHPPAQNGRAYAYSNLGYNMFGLVLDRKFSGGWRQVLEREVFQPLGMQRTTAYMSRADMQNLAQPYELRPGGFERVYYAKQDVNMHAAGGLLSTATDLARYLIAEINLGRIDGRQALAERAVRDTHQQYASQNQDIGPLHRFGWSLGLDMLTSDGDVMFERPGGFQGFRSDISFMPDRRIGVAVLTNAGDAGAPVTYAIQLFIYNRLRSAPDLATRDQQTWQFLADGLDRAKAATTRDLATRRARPQTTLLPLTAYEGRYENGAIGEMEWKLENDILKVQMGVARSDAEVFNGALHQFRVNLIGSGAVVTFDVPPGGDRPTGFHLMEAAFVRK